MVEKDFPSCDAAMVWIIQTQLGRRNLSSYQKSEMALRFEPLFKAQAKERQGRRTDLDNNLSVLTGGSHEYGDTRDILCRTAGISNGTLHKVKRLVECADEKTKQKLRRGDISISKTYQNLIHDELDDKASQPNEPSTREQIISMLRSVGDGYVAAVDTVMRKFTRDMVSEDNADVFLELFDDIVSTAEMIIINRLNQFSTDA